MSNSKRLPRRILIEKTDKPVLLSSSGLTITSADEFIDFLSVAYPSISSSSSSSSSSESTQQHRLIEDEQISVATQFHDLFSDHANLIIKSPMPTENLNLLAHLNELLLFIETVRASKRNYHPIWQRIVFGDGVENPDTSCSTYRAFRDMASILWSRYCDRRNSINDKSRNLWWLCLCHLWYLLNIEWRPCPFFDEVYKEWDISWFTSNSDGNGIISNHIHRPKQSHLESAINNNNANKNIISVERMQNCIKFLRGSSNLFDLKCSGEDDGDNRMSGSWFEYTMASMAYNSTIGIVPLNWRRRNNDQRGGGGGRRRPITHSNLGQSATMNMLFMIQSNWFNLHWNPLLELCVLCLWRTVCTFMFETDPFTVKKMDNPLYCEPGDGFIPGVDQFNKHSYNKKISDRFIYETEQILWRHLRVIDMYWFGLVKLTKRRDIVSFTSNQQRRQQGDNDGNMNIFCVPDGYIDELCGSVDGVSASSSSSPIIPHPTEQERRDFCDMVLNIMKDERSGKLIKSQFQNNIFGHFLLPGEVERYAEADSTVDRRPQTILSLNRRGDFESIAELVYHERAFAILSAIMTMKEPMLYYNPLESDMTDHNTAISSSSSTANDRNGNKQKMGGINRNMTAKKMTKSPNSSLKVEDPTIEQELEDPVFREYARIAWPVLIKKLMATISEISANDRMQRKNDDIMKSLMDKFLTRNLNDVLSFANAMVYEESVINTSTQKNSSSSGKSTTRPSSNSNGSKISQHKEQKQWLHLEENSQDLGVSSGGHIYAKLKQFIKKLADSRSIENGNDSKQKWDVQIFSIRGEYWVIHGNEFFVRTKLLINAIKWSALRMAYIEPDTYETHVDDLFLKIFRKDLREMAKISKLNLFKR